MNKRFIITLLTIIIIAVGGLVSAYIAKGYRVSPKTGTLVGTGIISVSSTPDQASVYLDGHLITATNTNINSLEPKEYTVKIHKDGFIDWEKKVSVKEGLITQIKATLFPALPSIYPLTYNGVLSPTLSSDSQKLAFIVPEPGKKGGIWVWTMAQGQIGFTRGGEPHQIMPNLPDTDLTKAILRWSPDSKQVLVNINQRYYLLEQDKVNDPPRDITPILGPTIKGWDDDQRQLDRVKFDSITDQQIRQSASGSAYLKWSPDETKFIYSKDGTKDFKAVDLKLAQTFNLPGAKSYTWLPDSLHIIVVDEMTPQSTNIPSSSTSAQTPKTNFGAAKVSVMEYEGTNKAEIFAGNFDSGSVFAWPDGSRIVMLYSLATTTASQPNLYGINLK